MLKRNFIFIVSLIFILASCMANNPKEKSTSVDNTLSTILYKECRESYCGCMKKMNSENKTLTESHVYCSETLDSKCSEKLSQEVVSGIYLYSSCPNINFPSQMHLIEKYMKERK